MPRINIELGELHSVLKVEAANKKKHLKVLVKQILEEHTKTRRGNDS